MRKLTLKHKEYLFFALIIISLVPFHWRSIFLGPTAIHLWAAADWYALALGFLDNGMDFLHPQVNQLNLQFPGTLSIDELEGITAVDFPINPYLVALLMKLFGTTSPMVYRGYTMVLSIIGLFFLFKAVKLKTTQFSWAVFVVALVRFQPSFAYYLDGFMPTQNALSVFFIGLYFFFRYESLLKNRHFFISILFFTLAALMRMPFAIPLIALLGTYVTISFHKKEMQWLTIGVTSLGLLAIVGYFLYNHSLSSTYGSVFLNELMPLRSWNDFVFFWLGGIARNSQSIFPIVYVFVTILIVFAVFSRFRKQSPSSGEKAYLLYFGIHFFGVFLYSILMGHQLWAHDYYFNDFFLPAFIIALIWSLNYVEIPRNYKNIIIGLFVAASSQTALMWQKYAYNVGVSARPEVQSTINFKDADVFLNEQNVPKDAVLLVIGTYAPSIPGNATNRKCFGVRVPKTEDIEIALSWPFDYIIIQNAFYNEVVGAYPPLENIAKPISSNGKLTIYSLRSAQ